jgi:Lon protease-like protein
MSDDLWALGSFKGTARLFPLPNLVLFPYVIQPLHIFEPRYRQMTADALADDRLLVLVLLRPGWESLYEGHPPLYSVACLGRIVADQRLDDGRYNLLLRGLSRVRIVEEQQSDKLYRVARVEVLHDTASPGPQMVQALRQELVERIPAWFPAEGAAGEQVQKLLGSDLPLGALGDIITFALPLTVEVKQQLLEIPDVEQRLRLLLRHLQKPQRKFPPDFSSN